MKTRKKEQAAGAKNKDGEKQQKKKAEGKLTPGQFLDTPYGLRLLQRQENALAEQPLPECSLQKENTEDQNTLYMKRLARIYITWIRASPICGNKRNQAYRLLKEVQKAVKVKAAENSKMHTSPNQVPAEDRSIEQIREDISQKRSRESQSAAGFSSLLLDTLSETTEGVYRDIFDTE